MPRLFVKVFDAEGEPRTVRPVDAREIVAIGGKFANDADIAAVGEKKEKPKKADPVRANKDKK